LTPTALTPTAVLVLESVHAALFMHGLLKHSLISMSQTPLRVALIVLSNT
jgi:hypothetical protein